MARSFDRVTKLIPAFCLAGMLSGGCDKLSVDSIQGAIDEFQGDDTGAFSEDDVEPDEAFESVSVVPYRLDSIGEDPSGVEDFKIEFDFDCIKIDRAGSPEILPPAGLKVRFRALDCNGDPIGDIESDEIEVINDEKGLAFGGGLEGGSVSGLGRPTSYELSSLLALDMSDSIHRSGTVDQMIDGALLYVDWVEAANEDTAANEIGVMVFGAPAARELVVPFTDDYNGLRITLNELRNAPSLGSTDLYGAYTEGLTLLDGQHDPDIKIEEHFFVLMTDGTHEAGNEALLRSQALDTLDEHPDVHVYTIGIDGAYDGSRLSELASTEENYVNVKDANQLSRAFAEIALRVEAVAKSNYVVGVCTPVALGKSAGLTIKIRKRGSDGIVQAKEEVIYNVEELNGDIGECSAESIADLDPKPESENPGDGDGDGDSDLKESGSKESDSKESGSKESGSKESGSKESDSNESDSSEESQKKSKKPKKK